MNTDEIKGIFGSMVNHDYSSAICDEPITDKVTAEYRKCGKEVIPNKSMMYSHLKLDHEESSGSFVVTLKSGDKRLVVFHGRSFVEERFLV